jgi:hypothetical protein
LQSLVAFVRKHDRRVAKQKEFMQRKIAEQNRKTEEARRQAIQRNMESVFFF